jgi:hypothetical protein
MWQKIDEIFDVFEREYPRIFENTRDGFSGKSDFPGGPFRIKSPLLYLLS